MPKTFSLPASRIVNCGYGAYTTHCNSQTRRVILCYYPDWADRALGLPEALLHDLHTLPSSPPPMERLIGQGIIRLGG